MWKMILLLNLLPVVDGLAVYWTTASSLFNLFSLRLKEEKKYDLCNTNYDMHEYSTTRKYCMTNTICYKYIILSVMHDSELIT